MPPHTEDPVPTLYCVFENQPIPSEIITQQIRYRRAERNLLAVEKSRQQGDLGSCLVIHLYL